MSLHGACVLQLGWQVRLAIPCLASQRHPSVLHFMFVWSISCWVSADAPMPIVRTTRILATSSCGCECPVGTGTCCGRVDATSASGNGRVWKLATHGVPSRQVRQQGCPGSPLNVEVHGHPGDTQCGYVNITGASERPGTRRICGRPPRGLGW